MKNKENIQLRVIPEFTDIRQVSIFESIVKKEADRAFLEQKEYGINRPYETIYSDWFISLRFQWDFNKGQLKQ
jgi:hypothetical protein